MGCQMYEQYSDMNSKQRTLDNSSTLKWQLGNRY